MRPSARAFFAAAALTTACGGPAPTAAAPATTVTATLRPPTPDADFRSAAPPAAALRPFTPPPIGELSLYNGMRALYVERHDMPIARLCIVSKVGVGDRHERPSVSALLSAMLTHDTTTTKSFDKARSFEAFGAQFTVVVSWDFGLMCAAGPASTFAQAVPLLADQIRNPKMDAETFDHVKRAATPVSAATAPKVVATNAAMASVYGRAHPYGHALSGTAADVKAATLAEVTRAYDDIFAPELVTLVAAGDVKPDVLKAILNDAFGDWQGKKRPKLARVPVPAVPPSEEKRPHVILVDRPTELAEVLVVAPGLARSSPDYEASLVLNTLLGGRASSRLNMNLRETHAYTYGVGSAFDYRHGPGPFMVGGSIDADQVARAIYELLREMSELKSAAVSNDDLARAKAYLLMGLPGRVETISETTGWLAEIAAYDLPLDAYAQLVDRLDKVTTADVARVAATYFGPPPTVVVVAPRAKVGKQLAGVFGELEMRDGEGNVAP
jgi:zinc protease